MKQQTLTIMIVGVMVVGGLLGPAEEVGRRIAKGRDYSSAHGLSGPKSLDRKKILERFTRPWHCGR